MLHEFVDPDDIPIILSIRISKTGQRDCFCWDHTKSGLYTVKSGYNVAHNMRRNNTYAPVLEPSSTGLKKAVWKLKAPRKFKHFLWQALSGYLATAEKLKSRHCTRDSLCVRCGVEVESINHTLFECPRPSNAGRYPLSPQLRGFSSVNLYMQILIISFSELSNVEWVLNRC